MLGPQSVDPPLHLLFHLVVLLLVATKIIVVIFTTILLLILSLLSSLLFIRSPGTPPVFQRGSTNPPRYQEKLSSSWIWLDRLPAWLQKSTSGSGLGKLTRIWCIPSLTQNHKIKNTRSFKIYIKLPMRNGCDSFSQIEFWSWENWTCNWQDHFVVFYFLSLFVHQFKNHK